MTTWRDIAASLRYRPAAISREAGLWADDVARVLAEVGQRPFGGRWDTTHGVSLDHLDRAFFAVGSTRVWPATPTCVAVPRAFWTGQGGSGS